MKFDKKWLLVVFVAFTQLALLLIAEMFWFDWFQSSNQGALAKHSAGIELIHQSEANFGLARSVSFFFTLFIGFIGCNLMVAILIRYKDCVNEANEGLEKVVQQRSKEVLKTRNAIIFGLAKLAESRDNDTGEHLDRIRLYVKLLSKDLAERVPEIDTSFIRDLELASSLHDIGKVGIPDSILLKPGGLTREEREVMEIHTIIGGECLDAIQMQLGPTEEFMAMARQVAYSHHERWDGTGYPHGLRSEGIPLVARIVAVADVYDALTSKRPYKRAMTHEESRTIIVEGSGSQFDPDIVASFLRNEDAFEAISIHQQFVTDEDAISDFRRRAETVTASALSFPVAPQV